MRNKIKLNELKDLIKGILREGYERGVINEEDEDLAPKQKIKYNGKALYVYHIDKPFKDYIYVLDKNGEQYYDVNTTLRENPLLGAVWVQVGGDEEKIANMLTFLERDERTTKSGYNTYNMYNIK